MGIRDVPGPDLGGIQAISVEARDATDPRVGDIRIIVLGKWVARPRRGEQNPNEPVQTPRTRTDAAACLQAAGGCAQPQGPSDDVTAPGDTMSDAAILIGGPIVLTPLWLPVPQPRRR